MPDDRSVSCLRCAGARLLGALGCLSLAVAAACSSNNGSAPSGADGGGDSATAGGDGGAALDADAASGFVLTSPAFAEGQSIPTDNTCAGANTSPELDWTPGPAAAQSYALVVTDLDTGGVPNEAGVLSNPIIHWVVWDIPADVRQLPAMLPGSATLTTPAGAKQVDLRTSPDAAATTNGYFGPCPNGNTHHYQFALHAMDVAALPGVTTATSSLDAKAAVLQHSIGEADLVGTSNARRPAPDGGGGAATDAGGQ